MKPHGEVGYSLVGCTGDNDSGAGPSPLPFAIVTSPGYRRGRVRHSLVSPASEELGKWNPPHTDAQFLILAL
jgi:hypothetical protein